MKLIFAVTSHDDYYANLPLHYLCKIAKFYDHLLISGHHVVINYQGDPEVIKSTLLKELNITSNLIINYDEKATSMCTNKLGRLEFLMKLPELDSCKVILLDADFTLNDIIYSKIHSTSELIEILNFHFKFCSDLLDAYEDITKVNLSMTTYNKLSFRINKIKNNSIPNYADNKLRRSTISLNASMIRGSYIFELYKYYKTYNTFANPKFMFAEDIRYPLPESNIDVSVPYHILYTPPMNSISQVYDIDKQHKITEDWIQSDPVIKDRLKVIRSGDPEVLEVIPISKIFSCDPDKVKEINRIINDHILDLNNCLGLFNFGK